MIETYKRTELSKLREACGFQFSKALGQNFLVDRNIIEKILDGADVSETDDIIEIGAGAGALTVPLARRARFVYAVEIDRRIIPMLRLAAEGLDNVEIVHADFLLLDPRTLTERYKLIGNLPYSITTPILARAIEGRGAGMPERMVFMVQKEVGERLLAPPGSRTYGAISVLVQYYCAAERICDVSREVFVPKPNVDSMVIRFTPYNDLADDPEIAREMFRIVKAGFGMRRKTLRNSLGRLGYTEGTLLAALEAIGIDPARRAETLGARDYYTLAKTLMNGMCGKL
ncbi:MAG: 16S rRNA (adenine(1518)-N(6)/adenine(1519)-N(6))-dimethyltransferase RsmA [Clostridiales Family XIII bacterium]|jgi:16S rRNA (adenine1518-N6/adenine1519-N6)-dimethyltransferase|nr:16S rRNA (adenine(1518)-N(6)/adenine(1519)-N(6))-dimethyltransferase RsmA [Clostridiales Family XIII bacterium]